ncbi:MAG: hypothetical protein SFU85_12280 [Candidatus Methylacidiphilales bacterium]|nr:hypothetical protein [Candidatus Methylacidiphilales bacterium]
MIDRTRTLTIKNPCPKSWAEMKGSETRRFCTHCSKHVHHLSKLSRPEAALLLQWKKGNLCAAYECGSRGEIHFTPVLTRVQSLIRPMTVGLLSAVLGLLGIGCSSSAKPPTPPATTQPPPGSSRMILGEIAPQAEVRPPSSDISPSPPNTPLIMGKVAAPEHPPKK